MEEKIFSAFLTVIFICITPKAEQLSFANSLFEEGDYWRAITEYKRYIFLEENQEKKLFAKKMILSSYKKAHRYEDALNYLDTFDKPIFKTMERGKLHLLKNDTKNAITYFNQIDSDTARILKGWAYMKEYDWKTSSKPLLKVKNDSNLYPIANELYNFASKADSEITQKNIAVAALLSSAIPGAGRLYTGRTGDAFFSFLTVAFPGVISYLYWQDDRKRAFSIAVGITAVFYAGDIYGSIVSAQKYNDLEQTRYLDRIESRLCVEEKLTK